MKENVLNSSLITPVRESFHLTHMHLAIVYCTLGNGNNRTGQAAANLCCGDDLDFFLRGVATLNLAGDHHILGGDVTDPGAPFTDHQGTDQLATTLDTPQHDSVPLTADATGEHGARTHTGGESIHTIQATSAFAVREVNPGLFAHVGFRWVVFGCIPLKYANQ
jgi:hypothetical protein